MLWIDKRMNAAGRGVQELAQRNGTTRTTWKFGVVLFQHLAALDQQ